MIKKTFVLCLAIFLLTLSAYAGESRKEPEVVVLGTTQASIDFYKSKDFWGPIDRKNTLSVPRIIVVAVNDKWKQDAAKMSVDLKKEFFFRAILPMILYENHEIMLDRYRLMGLLNELKKGKSLKKGDDRWLKALASRYAVKIMEADGKNGRLSNIDKKELMKRVDIIPLHWSWHRQPLKAGMLRAGLPWKEMPCSGSGHTAEKE